MATATVNDFPPMQGAIAQAESWTRYLNDRCDQADGPEDAAAALENIVWVGVHLGEALPCLWRLAFSHWFRRTNTWTGVEDFEKIRREVRRLFFAGREAMEKSRQAAEAMRAATGHPATGMSRLVAALNAACKLEEAVFRDWPSFVDAVTISDSLPVDESLARALGVTLEEAQEKMAARRSAQAME
jgi:hypothetical protein